MFGDPKGYIIVDKEITHTRPPGAGPLGEEYFDSLKSKMVPVMDISVGGDEYIVLGKTASGFPFLWFLDKRDTIGELIPAELIESVRRK